MANRKANYVSITLCVREEWLENIYQLIGDLSNGSGSNNKPLVRKDGSDATQHKLGKISTLVAKHCACGQCYDSIKGTCKSPWRTTRQGLYRASDGTKYLPCPELMQQIVKAPVGTLVSYIHAERPASSDNWRDKAERKIVTFKLDKMETDRQLRTAKLNALNTETATMAVALPKESQPKLEVTKPLRDPPTTDKSGNSIKPASFSKPPTKIRKAGPICTVARCGKATVHNYDGNGLCTQHYLSRAHPGRSRTTTDELMAQIQPKDPWGV